MGTSSSRLIQSLLVVAALGSAPALAVTDGHVDDFQNGTTQGWSEGAGIGTPNPNPPTNVASGGPAGAGDSYLQNVSAGGVGAGSRQIVFNTGPDWSGDFISAGIDLVRLDVRVDPASEGPLALRLAFEGTSGTRYQSTSAVTVPADGNWYRVGLPFSSAAMSALNVGDAFATAATGVTEVRLMHRPASQGWAAGAFDGTVGYDNIATLSASTFEGWLWETSVGNSKFLVELREDLCFGPMAVSITSDDHWTIASTDQVCYGRTTTNADPPRSFINYDDVTGTFPLVESFEARSTRPLVSAGGNLFEFYGEDVEEGIGQGENRFATLLTEPAGSDLLLLGGWSPYEDANFSESLGFLDLFVKSSPAVKAARTASDLQGRWYLSFINRYISRMNVASNASLSGLRVLDLQPAGTCTYSEATVIPEPEFATNGDYFLIAQFDQAGGVDLTNRGVLADVVRRTFTNCTYGIDGDGQLSVSYTSTDNSADPPVVTPVDRRFAVADDDNYFVAASDPDGVEENPFGLVVGYRAPTALAASALDGTYLLYLNETNYAATGSGHTGGATGTQIVEVFGRGRITFDSTAAGTVPPGQSGTWYGCDVEIVSSEAAYAANGQPAAGGVTASLDVGSDVVESLADCDYSLAADGSLLVNLRVIDPGQPAENVLLAGYASVDGQLLTFLDLTSVIENPSGPGGVLVDLASLRHVIAMRYTGDPDGNEDGDPFTNLEEFLWPFASEPLDGASAAGDRNGNGNTDIAVLLRGPGANRNFVYVMDGGSGAQLAQVAFGQEWAVGYTPVPDVTGDGIPEHAVLVEGSLFARVKNPVDGSLVSKPPFDPSFDPVALLSVGDVDGDSGPDLAVVGREPLTGRVQVQVKRISNESLVSRYNYAKTYVPLAAVVVDNVGGSPAAEIAVLGIDSVGRIRAQVKDARTGDRVSIVYFDRSFAPIGFAALPDPSGNLTYLAVLGRDADGVIGAQIKRVSDGSLVERVRFDSDYEPFAFLAFADSDADGSGEVAVVGIDETGKVRAQAKEIETGDPVGVINFDPAYTPLGATAVSGVAGTGRSEIAVLGIDATGQHRLQVKDLLAGTPVNNIEVP